VAQIEKKRLITIIIFTAVVIITATYLYSSLSNLQSNQTEKGKIGVMVTVGPQAEFVKKIGGEKVKVTVMVPPGADPHTYEPLPTQMKAVSDAQIYAEVGSGIEFELSWMDKIRALNPHMKVLNCSHGMVLLPGTEMGESSDPHVWVSPKKAKIMVENIYQGLVQTDPTNKGYYTINRNEYLQQLNQLDENITQTLAKKKNNIIMVYHPSWGYFCHDYNLTQISIESQGKEPTPQGIASLVDQARQKNIKIIFVTPQFSTRNAQVIANEIGGRVVVVDDLNKNYLENMRKVAEAFSQT
jgi:zinc transport system substrate-binding protein